MNKYKIQLRLHTLANCGNTREKFDFNGMALFHWDFSPSQGHKQGAWLVESNISANNFREADKKFTEKLNDLIPKIALISQCYTEYLNEPFLIHKLDSDIAYFQFSRSSNGVSLYFDNDSLEALQLLAKDQGLSKEFFYYWNDMINTIGYSTKLLLLCSALEALAKCKCLSKSKYKFLSDDILGKDLFDKIFARGTGIRNRLSHGEYFSPTDHEENYLEQAYKKVIEYFNREVFKKNLIAEDVTNPMRNPYGNKEGTRFFLRKKNEEQNFDLKELITEYEKDNSLSNYELTSSEVDKLYQNY